VEVISLSKTGLNLKRGDTFFFNMDLALADGTPLVVTVDKLKCQIRESNDKLVDTLLIETTDTVGRYLFTAPSENTVKYPAKELFLDVKINDGIVTSTPTISVIVDKDVTRWT
jgi:hypothetical protein